MDFLWMTLGVSYSHQKGCVRVCARTCVCMYVCVCKCVCERKHMYVLVCICMYMYVGVGISFGARLNAYRELDSELDPTTSVTTQGELY